MLLGALIRYLISSSSQSLIWKTVFRFYQVNTVQKPYAGEYPQKGPGEYSGTLNEWILKDKGRL